MAQAYRLNAGQTIAFVAVDGRIHVRCNAAGVSTFTHASASFGPYLVGTDWLVDGAATVTIADHVAAFNSLVLSNAGAPDNAAQATATLNPTGDDNSLIFTAREYGDAGNAISVVYADPGGTTAALAVSVFRQQITVSLARAASSITSTAAEVLAAVQAHGIANSLVTVALDEADTNFDDGSGVVTAMAATALEGGAGTGIGTLSPGGLLIDTTNANVYRNDGTQAAPVFIQLGDVA